MKYSKIEDLIVNKRTTKQYFPEYKKIEEGDWSDHWISFWDKNHKDKRHNMSAGLYLEADDLTYTFQAFWGDDVISCETVEPDEDITQHIKKLYDMRHEAFVDGSEMVICWDNKGDRSMDYIA